MTREQLEVFCLRIKEENEREREERNFFQMERDKIRTFWEITRSELEEARAKLRNKDRQIEEAAEKNEDELKFYKQKVKHLQYEHQNNLTDCKAEALQQSEELSKARNEFEGRAKELELKYEKKFADLKTQLNTKHDMEIAEVEERKNNQISELTQHHEKAFNEMKNYYNDITLNNLALISSLKDQMEVLRKQNERMTKQVADLTADNKKLTGPLLQAQNDVLEFKRQLQNYEKDKISLANTKAILSQTLKDLQDLQWSYDALELRFEKEILAKKNATISDLQYELARICKAHDDILETYEEKLTQYGIPKEELGFTPLRIVPEGQGGLSKGPAGLVTKNR
ncbi:hypothetical protein NQ314_019757 [Rhamnusium bicolor]|uniref:Dynein regulatory complex subunit 4 n=1 Tax=Rhamnusium bicolor TaxID=1586634 RepID=A0AAV8WN20_9CUCU|nr:hypothetical protein NQ314_019757 [Rhamnusium bicolor]